MTPNPRKLAKRASSKLRGNGYMAFRSHERLSLDEKVRTALPLQPLLPLSLPLLPLAFERPDA